MSEHPPIQWNRNALIEAIEANSIDYWRALDGVVGLRLKNDTTLFRTESPVPFALFNSVVRFTSADSGKADEQLDSTLTQYRKRDCPSLWCLGPSVQPGDLAERLIKRGLRHKESVPGMAIRCNQAKSLQTTSLTIHPVRDQCEQKSYADIFVAGFSLPPVSSVAIEAIAERQQPKYPMVHFLAKWKGEAVGTISLLFGSGVAGIYNVATLPEARGKGVATAMTNYALLEAASKGFPCAILHASKMGYPVYKRLGFETLCYIEQYIDDPT